MIADSIKTGMLEDMKETFTSPQDLQKLIEGKDKLKKRQSHYVGPDVPLACPLDPELASIHRNALELHNKTRMEQN